MKNVILNVFQRLIKSMGYKTLHGRQNDKDCLLQQPQFMRSLCYILLSTLYILYILPFPSFASELPIRGQARGESKIKVGDKAPLATDELKNAHKEGKVIALQLGYSSHCPWCDRMERYIREIMKDTNNFDNRAVFIQTQIEHAKMIAPPPDGIRLKEAFGVEGQPWLFIIDRQGKVRFIYKIFVSSFTFKNNIKELVDEGHKE